MITSKITQTIEMAINEKKYAKASLSVNLEELLVGDCNGLSVGEVVISSVGSTVLGAIFTYN